MTNNKGLIKYIVVQPSIKYYITIQILRHEVEYLLMWKDNHSILSGGEKKQYNSMIPSYNEYIMKDFIFV